MYTAEERGMRKEKLESGVGRGWTQEDHNDGLGRPGDPHATADAHIHAKPLQPSPGAHRSGPWLPEHSEPFLVPRVLRRLCYRPLQARMNLQASSAQHILNKQLRQAVSHTQPFLTAIA